MYIGKSKLDKRGRLTVPKSFIDANQVRTNTTVYFLPMTTSDNSVRLIFETESTPVKEEVNYHQPPNCS